MATAPKSKAVKADDELGQALEKALEIDFDEFHAWDGYGFVTYR